MVFLRWGVGGGGAGSYSNAHYVMVPHILQIFRFLYFIPFHQFRKLQRPECYDELQRHAHKARYIFECVYWIVNHLVMKLDQLIDEVLVSFLGEYFAFWRIGSNIQVIFNLSAHCKNSNTHYDEFLVVYSFECMPCDNQNSNHLQK